MATTINDEFEHAPRIWVNILLFLLTTLGAVVVVPWYGLVHGYSTAAWVSFFVLLAANGISITAGYHRLWAHRAYKAHWTVRLVFMLFGTMALQNSILVWASGHRRHHRFIDDNERDPYSAKRGFWFSHIGWMLRDYPSGRRDDSNIPDVLSDPIAVFQDRYYVPLVLLTNIGLPLAIGALVGDVWGVFLLGGLLRLVVNHHATFFINSLAHLWGSQPYTDANTARDNGLLAFLTYGEGYHNFHHRFASDYRNGVRWWQWDPTKWLIFALSCVGLASELRRVPAVRIQHTRLERQFKRLEEKLAHREQMRERHPQLAAIRERLSAEYESFKASFDRWRTMCEERLEGPREDLQRLTRETLAFMCTVRARLRSIEAQLAMA
jgi:stearoyl-CoA desaturase (delta-9 desaturase)